MSKFYYSEKPGDNVSECPQKWQIGFKYNKICLVSSGTVDKHY